MALKVSIVKHFTDNVFLIYMHKILPQSSLSNKCVTGQIIECLALKHACSCHVFNMSSVNDYLIGD